MAGYMTALQGYVYEGELANGAASAVENGMLVALDKDASNNPVFKLPAADTNTKLFCKEATTIYDGITAYRFVVKTLAKPYYFVENGFEDNNNLTFDSANFEIAPGKLLRAHPLLVGEEFVTTEVNGTPAVGTEYGVLATGKIG